jgi:hypothetical protein
MVNKQRAQTLPCVHSFTIVRVALSLSSSSVMTCVAPSEVRYCLSSSRFGLQIDLHKSTLI